MNVVKTKYKRRSFLKASTLAGGGIVLGFNWLQGCKAPADDTWNPVSKIMPDTWYDINSFLKIGENGMVTILSPNPEIGQNIKTSMPMIVAEELDCDWDHVVVEQAPLSDSFERQVAGGSGSIRSAFDTLRTAGATARQMLLNAAAKKWDVDVASLSTSKGIISNDKGETISYGELASEASTLEIPEEVTLKEIKDFNIIGTDRRNVDLEGILTGKALFGLDTRKEGMVHAVMLRPPAFGMKLKDFDAAEASKVNGVHEIVEVDGAIAITAKNTWAAMKAQKLVNANWEVDGTLENTEDHDDTLLSLLDKRSDKLKRDDGAVDKAYDEADSIFEKTYEAPFLPHNCMEPMNFFADVSADKVYVEGPIQTPSWTQSNLAEALNIDKEQIQVMMTRMGGGFGRRLYGNFVIEAAKISEKIGKPVQLTYSREDDMTLGIYRPASKYKFKAAIKDGEMTAYEYVGSGVNSARGVTRENWFPAGCLENYRVDSHNLESNITTGAWRAPVTNFLACAEQSFIDELAHKLEVDPVKFRTDLLDRAIENPVGEIDYEPEKLKGVIELVAEKSGWGNSADGIHQGLSAYYSHNTYVAEVADVVMEDGSPVVKKVTCAVDCGIVINPIAAKNQIEGGIVDGIGHAMYADFSFKDGKPSSSNFNTYRMIRLVEAPDEIDIHFVNTENHPTGLGEPSLPPAGGAIANAIAKATGKRLYKQPFINSEILG